ncbi:MAG: SurA N-terminal domain-containing protein [Vicinamibacterales bacterium]
MRFRLFAAAPLVVTLLACSPGTPPDPGPDVWATVNGTEIRRDRVERFYRSMTAAAQGTPSEEEALAAKLGLIDELITDQLLLARATALQIAPTAEEVDKAITEARGEMTEADFNKQLESRKTTLAEYREEITRELTTRKVIEQDVTNKVAITDEEVTAFYEQNKAQFNVPERQFHLAQIVVTSDPTQVNNQQNDDARSPGEAQRKIAMLTDALQKGESFAALAANFSEDPNSAPNGGDIGMVPLSRVEQAAPSLRRAVLGMKPGDMTTLTNGPVTTMLALVRVVEPGQRDLSDTEVKDGIRNGLKDRRTQLLQGAYLAKLRSDADVVNYLARRVVESNGKLPDAAK